MAASSNSETPTVQPERRAPSITTDRNRGAPGTSSASGPGRVQPRQRLREQRQKVHMLVGEIACHDRCQIGLARDRGQLDRPVARVDRDNGGAASATPNRVVRHSKLLGSNIPT